MVVRWVKAFFHSYLLLFLKREGSRLLRARGLRLGRLEKAKRP